MSQVSLIPILVWLAALGCAGVAIWRGPRPVTGAFVVDRLLRYLFIFPLGLQGLWAFVGHVFLTEQVAASIGWPASPFQLEVGMANLGIGLACLYAAFKGFEAWLAAALAAGAFLIGAGVIHIKEILAKKDSGDWKSGPGQCGPNHGHGLSDAHRRFRAALSFAHSVEAEIARDCRARSRA